MIPEFPLPPVDADFYKSQICNLPHIFGDTVKSPQLISDSSILFPRIRNPFASHIPNVTRVSPRNTVPQGRSNIVMVRSQVSSVLRSGLTMLVSTVAIV